MARTTFSTRALVTTILAWSFAALLVSGIVLFIAPPGRVAHWSGWRLAGLTKSEWQAVHTLTAVLFMAGGLFHILKFNWGPLKAYVRRSREAMSPFRGPVIAGTLLFALTLAGTLAGVPPFATVMDLGEKATNAWSTPDREPPVPHLELRNLEQVAADRGVPVTGVQRFLASRGLTAVRPEATLREIAEANGTTPSGIWSLLKELPGAPDRPTVPGGDTSSRGGGWGRLTVTEAADRLGLAPADVLRNLRVSGIVASGDDTIRELAARLGRTPAELVETMKGRAEGTTRD